MVGIAQVGVLAAGLRPQRGELRVSERAEERDDAAGDPGQEDEGGGVDMPRDDVRVDEDAGADDAAHDEHGGVEGTEAAGQGEV